MAKVCKDITRAMIGYYSGPDSPVMPTGITSDVNARLAKWREIAWQRLKTFMNENSTKQNEQRKI